MRVLVRKYINVEFDTAIDRKIMIAMIKAQCMQFVLSYNKYLKIGWNHNKYPISNKLKLFRTCNRNRVDLEYS